MLQHCAQFLWRWLSGFCMFAVFFKSWNGFDFSTESYHIHIGMTMAKVIKVIYRKLLHISMFCPLLSFSYVFIWHSGKWKRHQLKEISTENINEWYNGEKWNYRCRKNGEERERQRMEQRWKHKKHKPLSIEMHIVHKNTLTHRHMAWSEVKPSQVMPSSITTNRL